MPNAQYTPGTRRRERRVFLTDDEALALYRVSARFDLPAATLLGEPSQRYASDRSEVSLLLDAMAALRRALAPVDPPRS